MKRVVLAVLVLAMAVSMASAQTTQVLSRNAVGYTMFTVPPLGFNLVRLDFNGLGGSIVLSNAVGSQLPDLSQVIIWQPSLQTYKYLTKARGAWPEGTTVLTRGSAIFLKGASNAAMTNYQVFFMGEVPDRFTATNSTVTVFGSNAFSFVGYSYPVAIAFSNLAVGPSLSNLSQVALWDMNAQSYNIFSKGRGTWPPALASNIIQAGQGFWIRNVSNAVNWVEVKPYTWP